MVLQSEKSFHPNNLTHPAKAMSGYFAGASQALFEHVSTRDPNYTQSTHSGDDLINEIKQQRKIELWGEGFGLKDLKRWNDPIVRVYPGSNHPNIPSSYVNLNAGSILFTFQIPETEINTNLAINQADQNP